MPGKLILVRHGQSIWNVENLFTGWHDVDLSEAGRLEARSAGQQILSRKAHHRYGLHVGPEARHSHLVVHPG